LSAPGRFCPLTQVARSGQRRSAIPSRSCQ
jgi:hypothetical protein